MLQVPITEADISVFQCGKQCQVLKEENHRLDRALRLHQESNTQAMDNVFLQTQIDTLQWQLKQNPKEHDP
ncbi:hypothetical protein PV327_003067 [Microctonus hyperodae]|uniref:Uncharacterized protein n=1 Tax=Microctonus hyperodae TaxID=165561 RepID=A0AA39G3P3_MICHY|nr:hypothetical protein PV327_003067 [Microctonus hyperodae]